MTNEMKAYERVVLEVALERERQIEKEGWTPEHDDHHSDDELANAAACYASTKRLLYSSKVVGGDTTYIYLWPWRVSDWKPKNRRRDLIRAAALIVAEIERLDRSKP
jgi:hypothetical protein